MTEIDGFESVCLEDSSEMLGLHHEKISILGEGGFGEVFKCFNRKTEKMEAVKVIREDDEDIAMDEIQILEKLAILDPDKCNLVRFNNFFFHENVTCLSFELLDINLDEYIASKNGESGAWGLPLSVVRVTAEQMSTALYHLKSIGIVHGDIKPGNIMVVDRHQQPIIAKLGDFGGAQLISEINPPTLVHTCAYSPPELLLKSACDESIDVWSLGVTLLEMALGEEIFVHNEAYDVLRCTVKIFGQPPDHVLDGGRNTPLFFNREMDNDQQWVLKSKEQYRSESNSKKFPEPDPFHCFSDIKDELLLISESHAGLCPFLDLIQMMLHVDPEKRISPLEALQHPFFVDTDTDSENAIEDEEQSTCSSSEEEIDNRDSEVLENSREFETESNEISLEPPADVDLSITQLIKDQEENVDKIEKQEVRLELPAEVSLPTPVNDANKNDEVMPQENCGEVKLDKQEVQLELSAEVCLPTPVNDNPKKDDEVTLREKCGEVKMEKHEVRLELPAEVCSSTPVQADPKKNDDVTLTLPSADVATTLEDDSKDTGCFTSICRHVKNNAKWYGGALVFAAAACSVVMLVRSKS